MSAAGGRPRTARLLRRPVIVLTAAVIGLGAAGGLTGMALGGIGAASSDPGVSRWHHHHDRFDGPFDRD
jgi:hypothetical protein